MAQGNRGEGIGERGRGRSTAGLQTISVHYKCLQSACQMLVVIWAAGARQLHMLAGLQASNKGETQGLQVATANKTYSVRMHLLGGMQGVRCSSKQGALARGWCARPVRAVRQPQHSRRRATPSGEANAPACEVRRRCVGRVWSHLRTQHACLPIMRERRCGMPFTACPPPPTTNTCCRRTRHRRHQ